MKPKESGEIILDALHTVLPLLHVNVFTVIHNFTWNTLRLKENQLKVLLAVEYLGNGNSTSTKISKGLNLQKGTLTTIIRSLIDFGLMQKEISKSDERVYLLSLTAKGKSCLQARKRHDLQKLNRLFQNLPPNEAKKNAGGIESLTAFLRKPENTAHQ